MKKKLLSLLMIMAIMAGVVFSPLCVNMTAQAKTPYMKKLGVKWDLKEGKWVTIRINYAGNVWNKAKATIKDVKLKDAQKEGYKKLSYTIVIKEDRLTPSKVHKIGNAANGGKVYGYGLTPWLYDIDGFSITSDNDSDIKDKGKWTYSKKYKCKDSHGCWVGMIDTYKYKCIVVYPEKDYKKICIGISGNGSYKHPAGTGIDVWERPVYKKDKKNIHFMLVG